MMIHDHDVGAGRVRFPIPPDAFHDDWAIDMDVYVRFARAMRDSAITKPEQRVLVAITTVATQMAQELSIEDVSVRLVGLGLRAPRGAFPGGFVDQVLACQTRHKRRGEQISKALTDLLGFWGVPVAGVRTATYRAPAAFRIGSIPKTLNAMPQNSFGLCFETAL
jgi:hypothetical protein